MSVPLTLAAAYRTAQLQLKQAGVETAGLDAQLLLGEVLGKSREYVIGYPESRITEQEWARYNALIARRADKEPLAYITGRKEFWGRSFRVNRHTLVPRPDTETVIEAVEQLRADHQQALHIGDFGTGSGCILLTLLAEYPEATGVAIDTSPEALEIVQKNACELGVKDRLRIVESDWDAALDTDETFDLLVSNPPYIAEADRDSVMPDVAQYEPEQALFAGPDGLDAYRALAPVAVRRLRRDGHAVLEAGAGQADAIAHCWESAGLQLQRTYKDLSGIDRALIFRHKAE